MVGQKRKVSNSISSDSEVRSLEKKRKRKAKTDVKDDDLSKYSGLFNLQLVDLLNDVKLNYAAKEMLNNLLNEVKACLLNTYESEYSHEINDHKWLKEHSIVFPLPFDRTPPNAAEYQFAPPVSIEIVGSYSLDITVKPNFTVDLVVEIPASCLGKRDYLNEAYFYKRSLYLCTCAIRLQKKMKSLKSYYFERFLQDPRCPALVLKPKDQLLMSCKIRLLPRPCDNFFKLSRFLPTTNNVRPNWYFDELTNSELPPTPIYNNTMLTEILLCETNKRIIDAIGDSSILREALIVLRHWLSCRNLSEGIGGFSSFLMSVWLLYLNQNGCIKSTMTTIQVLRTVFAQFVQTSWLSETISLYDSSVNEIEKMEIVPVEVFRGHFSLVFIDWSGRMNLAANLSISTYHRLVHEAGLATQFLESQDSKAFDWLFVTPVPFVEKFDHIFHISNCDEMKCYFEGKRQLWKAIDSCGDFCQTIEDELYSLIKQGLGQRILLIDIERNDIEMWSISSQPPSAAMDKLTFGLLLDTNEYNSVLERGPTANSAEAETFRKLWGDKSDLRKFADSTICEAVVWKGDNLVEKRLIPQQIVLHLMKLHMNIPEIKIRYIATQLETVIGIKDVQSTDEGGEGTMSAFEKLRKCLRLLEGLPLGVANVQPIAAALRRTEPFLPGRVSSMHLSKSLNIKGTAMVPRSAANRCPPWCPSFEIQITLETSGKWPDDIEAVRKLKSAFYVQIAQLLKDQFKLCTLAYSDNILVLVDDYVFRLLIVYNREVTLLCVTETETGLLQSKPNSRSLAVEKMIVWRPKVTGWLYSLSQQNESFGLICRLAKRWISVHLLSDFLQEEAIELIVASLFVSPEPFIQPKSALVGFTRFLFVLSLHDWLRLPLIVNFNNTLSGKEISELEKRFVSIRPTLPAMCIYTPDDPNGTRWTRPQPLAVILNRIINLARTSLHHLRQYIMSESLTTTNCQITGLFEPSLDSYDVIIWLRRRNVPRISQSINVNIKGESISSGNTEDTKKLNESKMPVVDFDPVQLFVRELRECYDEFALFFYDKYGGDAIGVLWKPRTKSPIDVAVSRLSSRKLIKIDCDDNLVLDVAAVLEDFELIGKDLVKNIVRKDNS